MRVLCRVLQVAAWPGKFFIPIHVRVLCRVLQGIPSGYYAWRHQHACPTPAWQPAARVAFKRHAERYGTRRLRAELQAEGHAVGRCALRTWLRRHSWRSTRAQRPRTTEADPQAVAAENRLLHQPPPAAPDQVWVGDITYWPLVGGRWCYLTTWRDACSRRVLSLPKTQSCAGHLTGAAFLWPLRPESGLKKAGKAAAPTAATATAQIWVRTSLHVPVADPPAWSINDWVPRFKGKRASG